MITNSSIAQARLYNQGLVTRQFTSPEDVVQWLGAVQAQEYAGTKWGIAQRSQATTDAVIDQAFADGKILRTHLLRPTWHFVVPSDIHWMLSLTAPRVHALNAYQYRQWELDDTLFTKSRALLEKALQGNRQLTRQELADVLASGGITASGVRLACILMHAELDAVICSGALRGKQHTYALLSERVPHTKTLTRDQSLAELAKRYFTSHGPATLKDFIWWSGLSSTDARAGLALIKPQFVHEVVDSHELWFSPNMPTTQNTSPICSLLSDFDEYTVAYTNRASFLFDTQRTASTNALMSNPLIMNGHIVGTWRATIKKKTITIAVDLSTALDQVEIQALEEAVERYGEFMGLAVISSYTTTS